MKKHLTDEQKAELDRKRKAFRDLSKLMVQAQEGDDGEDLGIVTVEGHLLSALNQRLIQAQHEHATKVGGFRQWIAHGRCVRKGEHGLNIWIPRAQKEDPNRKPGEISSADLDVRFICGTVFDISQTEVLKEKELVTA